MARRTRRRISLTLEGRDADKGDVRLQDFIRKLMELRDALRQTERTVTGSAEPSVYWRIVDLRHNSPSTVVLEEVEVGDESDKPIAPQVAVVERFAQTVKNISKTDALPRGDLDLDALESYRALGTLSENSIKKLMIRVGNKQIAISAKFNEHLEKIIGPDETERGSIAGMLEAINLHNTSKCNVYPIVGPKKVVCTFDDGLKQRIIEGLDRYVQVSGTLRYKQWSMHPHAIDVESVEVLPNDPDLPTLQDLRGTAPDATGDMSTEDFLEALRDGSW